MSSPSDISGPAAIFPSTSGGPAPSDIRSSTEATQPASLSSSNPLPALSLPKGGGAIRGIGEKFGVNPVTGTGSLTVPLASSPGRSGFGPQLSLSYDSGAGNGPFGFGWSLQGVPSITRKTEKGLPRYQDGEESDVFVLSGAEDLVPVLNADGQRAHASRTVHGIAYDIYPYRPRIEGLFARIERWREAATGISHWRSISGDNVTTLYGFDEQSRVVDPTDSRKIFSCLISRTFDDKGNLAVYQYLAENNEGVDQAQAHESNRTDFERVGQRYLKAISYGNVKPYYPDWSGDGDEPPPVPDGRQPLPPADVHFQVVLDYGDHSSDLPLPSPDRPWLIRPDPFSSYRAGFEVRTYRRCRRVLVFHHFPDAADVGANCLVRSTDFLYSDEAAPADLRNPIYTFLRSVSQTGYRRRGDGYLQRSMPPLEFEYSQPEVQPDVLTLDRDSLANLPVGLNGSGYQWADLDGEGLSGILTDFGGEWGYKRNTSPINRVTLPDGSRRVRARFDPIERVATVPSRSELSGGQQLLDLSGDGQLDVATFEGTTPGFYERTLDQSWEPFQQFAFLPCLDWSEPSLRFVDLTGDGHADVLLAEDDLLTFYPSLGELGFDEAEQVRLASDEERAPRMVVADEAQSISLADMSGDGLSDIVRVRNGEVCYWPNLGYGRFGPKVTMDLTPRLSDREQFDPRRVRLADIDGSGTTDLVYVGADGVVVCFNCSGNSWAEPHLLAVFPTADSVSGVQATDLLGNGTACLVWSSPLPAENADPVRYVDLMGGEKPHLLIRIRNNLGAETRLSYAPSTRFYLTDRRAGSPWLTRLPFPVHVVERIETFDWIGRSRFVTRYSYHHGFFDGFEREFRGFGLVEQWDTEEHRGDSDFPDADALNWDEASWTPPMRTRTWFHTGVFQEAGVVSRQYEHEYWAEPALRTEDHAEDREAMMLPDTVLPPGLSPPEVREAYRALKGIALRTEIYAEDGSERAEHPYSVSEQNYSLRLIQPTGSNRHAVFHVHAREKVTFQYERGPKDPRVTHAMTLEADDFGNVRRSVSIGYPRREGYPEPEPDLANVFRKMLAYDQTRLHMAATENRFTNVVTDPDLFPVNSAGLADLVVSKDAHRVPLRSESITAELTGLVATADRPSITNVFAFDEMDGDWQTVWDGAHDVPYEEIPAADIDGAGLPVASPTRRIVEHTRTLYRRNDLTDLLPLNHLDPNALPGELYRLALTPALVTRVFGDRVTDDTLKEGGYAQMADGSDWWIPSGRVFYSPGEADDPNNDDPAKELVEARAHFYMPRRAVDPFGAITLVAYEHDLLPVSTIDAVGNTTAAANDYRVLLPFRITDPNGNRAEVAFDALGLVAGSALMGKTTENFGDSLTDFDPDTDEAVTLAHLGEPLKEPNAILNKASSRMLYDLFAYFRTREQAEPDPPVVYTLARETHVSDLPTGQPQRYQHSFAYSDGFARAIQRKVQAEPGPLDPGPLDGSEEIVSPRWVGSGWMINDNKGRPVRLYEPFFTATHRFEFARKVGVSSVLFYDPPGRVIATLHPNDTWEKVVFDAWRQESWDASDTVKISDPRADPDVGHVFARVLGDAPDAFVSWHDRRIGGTWGDTPEQRAAEQDAAEKAADHAGTWTVTHLDSIGRTCLTVSDNGMEERYPSRAPLDIEGKPLAFIDAFGRRVFEYCLREPREGGGFRYVAGRDLAGTELYHDSMDGGERRSLATIAGKPLRSWDARGHVFSVRYDLLQRPSHLLVSSGGGPQILLERSVYGEGLVDRNLGGRLFRRYDGAGMEANERYDFKGNLLESTRQVAHEHTKSIDWSALASLTVADELDAASSPLLVKADRFVATTNYDALNRPIQFVTPHGGAMQPNVVQPSYNEAGLLDRVDVWIRRGEAPAMLLDPETADCHAIVDTDYDARGRRTRVVLGNGTTTMYEYDSQTFRLANLRTTRDPADYPGDCPAPPPSGWPGCRIQNVSYAYDPVGNVTRIRDDGQQTVFFRNQRVEPSTDFTYDALYRLTRATGREHLGQTASALNAPAQVANSDEQRAVLHPGDGNAMGTYTETYEYDPVGNLLKMAHHVASGGWTRRYRYVEPSEITSAETSNRLSATSLPPDDADGPYGATYGHDAHGNMVAAPHLPSLGWDERDRLRSSTRQIINGGASPETTFYVYGAGGERVQKVTDRQAAGGVEPKRSKQRLSLGQVEIYREYSVDGETVTLERETLHVQAGEDAVALVETRTVGDDSGSAQLVRYQYGNYLGSAALELDARAAVISYEEYFPYGSTSYQAVSSQTETPKRYRYTGKERDGENDLYYHGARYYAPWLGRWTSPDPAGMVDGSNLFRYALCNPTTHSDPTGHAVPSGSLPDPVGDLVDIIDPQPKKLKTGLGAAASRALGLPTGESGSSASAHAVVAGAAAERLPPPDPVAPVKNDPFPPIRSVPGNDNALPAAAPRPAPVVEAPSEAPIVRPAAGGGFGVQGLIIAGFVVAEIGVHVALRVAARHQPKKVETAKHLPTIKIDVSAMASAQPAKSESQSTTVSKESAKARTSRPKETPEQAREAEKREVERIQHNEGYPQVVKEWEREKDLLEGQGRFAEPEKNEILEEVNIGVPRGSRAADFAAANALSGRGRTSKPPEGTTWHHSERLGVMQLLPRSVHERIEKGHIGGVAIWEKALGMKPGTYR